MVISSFVVVSSVSTGDQSVKVFLSCSLLGSVADVRPSDHTRTGRRGADGPWRAPPGNPACLRRLRSHLLVFHGGSPDVVISNLRVSSGRIVFPRAVQQIAFCFHFRLVRLS